MSQAPGHGTLEQPEPTTATTRAAVADAIAGRSGVLRNVQRDADPDVPDADDAPVLVTAAA